MGFIVYKVDFPVDGKYLREALFKNFVLRKNMMQVFPLATVFRIHFFYFESREYFKIEILKTPQHFNFPFFISILVIYVINSREWTCKIIFYYL